MPTHAPRGNVVKCFCALKPIMLLEVSVVEAFNIYALFSKHVNF